MIEPIAGAANTGGAVEAALLALAAPGRDDLGPPRILPSGAIDLIRVAAEDQTHAEVLAARFGVDVRRIEDAALHFVHAVMFHPDSDHFRVLGVRPDADEETLKIHFRWLQKWLHPDRDPEGWVSVYAERVNIAWAQLRRADRRAEYRESLGELDLALAPRAPLGPGPAAMEPAFDAALAAPTLISSRWARRLPALVIGAGGILALALFAAHRVGENLLQAERSARERTGLAVAPSGAVSGPGEFAEADAQATTVAEASRPRGNVSPGAPDAATNDTGRVAASPESVPAGPGLAADGRRVAGPEASEKPRTGAEAAGRQAPQAMVASAEPALAKAPASAPGTRIVALQDTVQPAAVSVAEAAAADRSLPVRSPAAAGTGPEPRPDLSQSPREDSNRQAEAGGPIAAPSAGPLLPVASQTPARAPAAAAGPVPKAEPVAAVTTRRDPLPASGSELPVSRPEPLGLEFSFDPAVGRRVLNQFSSAYREGQVQELVVLFAPNARTPEGNLVDLHQRYGSLFAASSRRSLEFLDLEWRELPNGLEGIGRYEWAMRPRGVGGTRATAGRIRVVIEFVDGRPLIVLLDQQDVG